MEQIVDWMKGLLCPAMLCDFEGKLCYRNPAALRLQLGSMVGTMLSKTLSEEEWELFRSGMRHRRCEFLRIPAADGERQMLFCPVRVPEGRWGMLLGFSFFQTVHFDRAEAERRLAAVGDDLLPWLLRQGYQPPTGTRNILRAYDLHVRLLRSYLGELQADRPENMAVLGDLLCRIAENLQAFCGADIRIELHLQEPQRVYLAEAGNYLSVLLALTQALVLFGGFRRGCWSFYLQERRLVAMLELRDGDRPLPDILPEDPADLADWSRTVGGELLLLSGVCRLCSFRTSLRKSVNGMHAVIDVPKSDRQVLRAEDLYPKEPEEKDFGQFWSDFLRPM